MLNDLTKKYIAAAATLFLAAVSVSTPASADGAVATTNTQEVCTRDYAKLHRSHLSRAVRASDFERAGVPWTSRNDYELDHIVPLCLGGADVPENRRPQRLEDAVKKDAVETFACQAVCQGQMTLDKAQAIFLTDQWRAWQR